MENLIMNKETQPKPMDKREHKLQLKHIAAYLQYGIQISGFGENLNVIGITTHSNGYIIYKTKSGEAHVFISDIKPILRPLSDLTKEIEHNGDNFVPINRIEQLNPHTSQTWECVTMLDGTVEMHYWREYELLLSWHFDIFGLIEKDLAIDINTLQK